VVKARLIILRSGVRIPPVALGKRNGENIKSHSFDRLVDDAIDIEKNIITDVVAVSRQSPQRHSDK
jgi:hypothetical protein